MTLAAGLTATMPVLAQTQDDPPLTTADPNFDPSLYAPTFTSPTCGSSITIEDGMGGYNEVAISLSWGSTVTPTGIYWFMEDHDRNLVEGRQTDTATFTVTPDSTWLEDDSRIEITIVGETATAKYPRGTGPGTKVVFTPEGESTGSAGCGTQAPVNGRGLSMRSVPAGTRYAIGDRDSMLYVKPVARTPDAPGGLTVVTTEGRDGELDVSWTAPASDGGSEVTGYKVQWKSGAEAYDGSASSTRQAVVSDPAVLSHRIAGLTVGTAYTVRVMAVNAAGDGAAAEATATVPVLAQTQDDPPLTTADPNFDPGLYAPTFTSPTCGSSITIEDGMGGYNEVAIALSWGSTVTPTGIYWFMEDHDRNLVEGRQTDTATFTVTPDSTWLEDDSRIEITIVGETATAKYPSGTGPGTKVVFTPEGESTDSAGCGTQAPVNGRDLSVRRATAEPRYVIGDHDSIMYIKRADPGDETAAVLSGAARTPDAPGGLTVATAQGRDGELDVSWTAPASDGGSEVTGYKVQWKSGAEAYDGSASSTRQAVVSDPAVLSHRIAGLTVGTAYTVRVMAVNAAGDGAAAEATATAAVRLTAQFEGVPEAHDGAAPFSFELRFSEEVELGYRTVRDLVLEVDGGLVTRATRLARPSNMRWEITVSPESDGAVTVVLPAGRACGTSGAVCTKEGSRALSEGRTAVVPGPRPRLSIEAGTSPVTEGAEAVFTLARTGDASAALTVTVEVTESGAMLSGAAPTEVTFEAESATAALALATADDEAVEDASAVAVTVAAGDGHMVAADAASATVTVEDDDTAPEVVTASALAVAENATAVATLVATDADTDVGESRLVDRGRRGCGCVRTDRGWRPLLPGGEGLRGAGRRGCGRFV